MHQLDPELGCVIGVIELRLGRLGNRARMKHHVLGDSICSQEIRLKKRSHHFPAGRLGNAHRKFDSRHECQRNSIQNTSVSSHHMSDGVLFRDQLRKGEIR